MLFTNRDRERWQQELREIRSKRPGHLPRLSIQREAEIIASRLGYAKTHVSAIRTFLIGRTG